MVERLKAAGGIMLGKTNTPTFGWMGVTHNLLFGATRNPWALDRSPGGSSGGASPAAAAGLRPLHNGADGRCPIRLPASVARLFWVQTPRGGRPCLPGGRYMQLLHLRPVDRN